MPATMAAAVSWCFASTAPSRSTATECPKAGTVRVLDRPGEDAELVYLASHRADAECWLQSHGYPRAVLDEVTAAAVAADVVEGTIA